MSALTERERRKAELLLGILAAGLSQLEQATPIARDLFGDSAPTACDLLDDCRAAVRQVSSRVAATINHDGSTS